jgi:DNA-binding transcriptional LysR family regulator
VTPKSSPPRPAIGAELDLRSLRYFVAVAEELHFTRAANRMLVAQQALSREVRRLEERLGVRLFVRSTRSVKLTEDGERLLGRARELLAVHDALVAEMSDGTRPLVVDLLTEAARTGLAILAAAQGTDDRIDFRRRYSQGMAAAVPRLVAGEADVAFGRVEGLGRPLPAELVHSLVRREPVGLLVPDGHPLGERSDVPSRDLRDVVVDGGLDNPHSPEWADFARQLIDAWGAVSVPAHTPAEGLEDESEHLRRQGVPIITVMDRAPVDGGVVVGVVEPVPLYPVSIVHRRDSPQEVGAIVLAGTVLSRRLGWLGAEPGTWLPQPEAGRPGRPTP